MHTSGKLGDDEVVVTNVTTNGRESGEISGLGPRIVYEDTTIDMFNIYVAGDDWVRIDEGVVNEANTAGSSRLTIEDCTLEYNLVQAYDRSTLTVENCSISADQSTQPSLTAEGEARVMVRGSDCARLEAQAIESGRIDFEDSRNLDLDRLTVQDSGQIHVDGRRVR